MEKLSVTLPDEMVHLIKSKVASGAFASTSEVLREAMRTWIRREEEHEERLKAIRAKVQESLNDPRPRVPADEAFARIRQAIAAKRSGE